MPNSPFPPPIVPDDAGFNPQGVVTYGCSVAILREAMRDFVKLLGILNDTLTQHDSEPLELLLMPANFSSFVGEFLVGALARQTPTLVKNRRHNGHPDLLPAGHYPGDAVLHGSRGIEVKASRYRSGWQGHNAEATWLLVFVFESMSSAKSSAAIAHPFRFLVVAGADITSDDWSVSGRSATSRRTPTAAVKRSGYDKIMKNWLYRHQS